MKNLNFKRKRARMISDLIPALVVPSTIIFAILHFLYEWWLGLRLFAFAGGVTNLPNGWTEYGTSNDALTIPISLPGTVLLDAGNKDLGPLAWLLIFAGSIVTAYAMVSACRKLLQARHFVLGHYKWEMAFLILGLIWIPVPENLAFVYCYTVAF